MKQVHSRASLYSAVLGLARQVAERERRIAEVSIANVSPRIAEVIAPTRRSK